MAALKTVEGDFDVGRRRQAPAVCGLISGRRFDRGPDFLRRYRHIDVTDPKWLQRVANRVHGRGRPGNGRGLATALRAERVGRANGLEGMKAAKPTRPW